MIERPKFLEQVAKYYVGRAAKNGDLADYTFVMPNKRSALFLKKYIRDYITSPVSFMPHFVTITQFTERYGTGVCASYYDRLFTLYNAWRKVLTDAGRTDQIREFDKFIFWGDIILNDFDDIDTSLADARMLYRNLNNLKTITSDYLSAEQKEVIRRIWGDTEMTGEVKRFWLHTGPGKEEQNPMSAKFIALWRILADIYDEYFRQLNERGLSTEGMIVRRGTERIKAMSAEDFGRKRVVFVGQANLTTAQNAIMAHLQKIGVAEFIWDLNSPLFFNQDRSYDYESVQTMGRYLQAFPMPEDFDLQPVPYPDAIEVIGIPSVTGQARQAGKIIRSLLEQGRLSGADSINTAIVIPDAKLLMSVMLSLPDELEKMNVTMTVPYGTTSFATFFKVIVAMHRRIRKRHSAWCFFYEDILELSAHPYMQLLAPGAAEKMRDKIYKGRLYNIEAEELCRDFETLSFIFRPIEVDDIDHSYQYVSDLLHGLKRCLPPSENAFEFAAIDAYIERVDELYHQVKTYDIVMTDNTFLYLFDKVLNSTPLSVAGTPLQGMQVMGVLETRALDFDNIIYLSMNERIFPRRNYVHTMIPNNLRVGYGLSPIGTTESFYAYHFLRSICRARRVWLLYDTRRDTYHAGEMSRYLSRLLFVKSDASINHSIIPISGELSKPYEIKVEKTPKVMSELETFKREGGARLSASSLKTYMMCPLSFYLQFVKGLKDNEEPTDYMSGAETGTIFHNVMEELLRPYKNKKISVTTYTEIFSRVDIHKLVLKHVCAVGYKSGIMPEAELKTEGSLAIEMIEQQVRRCLEAEQNTYTDGKEFTYVAGEFDVQPRDYGQWQITDDLRINFRMKIDRIDKVDTPDGDVLRFIDYKTGGNDDNTIGATIDNLFDGKPTRQGIFQLLLYGEAYRDLVDKNARIVFGLHKVREISKEGIIKPLTYNKKTLDSYPDISSEFRPRLNKLVAEIFDENTAFGQCETTTNCTYCQFVRLCGRQLPEKDY